MNGYWIRLIGRRYPSLVTLVRICRTVAGSRARLGCRVRSAARRRDQSRETLTPRGPKLGIGPPPFEGTVGILRPVLRPTAGLLQIHQTQIPKQRNSNAPRSKHG